MEIASTPLKSLIEPLIDLIHGDVVLQDICCQRVASAFVERHHEAALRDLLASHHLLPQTLEKAIDIYCVRSYILSTPELLLHSGQVVQMLEELADIILTAAAPLPGEADRQRQDTESGTGEEEDDRQQQPSSRHRVRERTRVMASQLMSASGEVVKKIARSLQLQEPVDAQRACLTDALGDAVVGYIMCAAKMGENDASDYLNGASWQATHAAHASYQASLQQFAKSALVHREAQRQARQEEVETLLFGDESVASPRKDSFARDATTLADFANEVQAAMGGSQDPPPSLLKHPFPGSTRRGNLRLLSVDDSLQAQCDALESAVSPLRVQPLRPPRRPDAASTERAASSSSVDSTILEITADTSAAAARPGSILAVLEDLSIEGTTPRHSRKMRKAEGVPVGASETSVLRMLEGTTENTRDSDTAAVHTGPSPSEEDIWKGLRRCLQTQDAEVRRYFLCPSTQRFEPLVARGFFSN